MGLLDFMKKSPVTIGFSGTAGGNSKAQFRYADSSSISPDERPYYQPDSYYTFYSYPGTTAARKVVTFDERKRMSYPSSSGLYVAEILLLDYCSKGKYPKPSSGYPGLWWFEYGIRDVGHALESIKDRGFIRYQTKYEALSSLKMDQLKKILRNEGLPENGKKAELVERITESVSEDKIQIDGFIARYVLTESGQIELGRNGYVPYMHKHRYKTTEGGMFGKEFNVWSINRCFKNGDASDWKSVVRKAEKEVIGTILVDAMEDKPAKQHKQVQNTIEKTAEPTGNPDRYCPQCGSLLDEGALFCGKCGTRIGG